jgi:NAD+ diphosphatase
MMQVVEGPRLLLARRPGGGYWSVLAGYVEAGESAESAAAREVAEEVGLVVERLDYVRSQAWPESRSLVLGFTATVTAGDPKVDGEEIAEARWWDRRELHEARAAGLRLAPAGSLARWLVERWCVASAMEAAL